MHHAIRAFLVIAGAVRVPIRLVHQLRESLGVAFAEEIAGPLPAEIIARGVAPRRAMVALIAGEEVEEQRGLAERPFLRAVAALEDAAEKLLGLAPIEEMRLIGGALIGIARRHGDAIDAARHDIVEEPRHALGIGAVEEGAIDVDAKSPGLRRLDGGDGA